VSGGEALTIVIIVGRVVDHMLPLRPEPEPEQLPLLVAELVRPLEIGHRQLVEEGLHG
jgi:hypothetical protein